MRAEDFIPEGLGAYDTFRIPSGADWAPTGMEDPMGLYKMALAQEHRANVANMAQRQSMQGIANLNPIMARMGRMENVAGLQNAPYYSQGIPRATAQTGAYEFAAGKQMERNMAEAQNQLMDYISSMEDQEWYQTWAPVLGAILGAATGGLGLFGMNAAMGSSIGGGIGETYARS